MTSLFSTRRRAEEFDAAVEAAPARPTGPSGHQGELEQLVGLATVLREHHAPSPSSDFVADLRGRLLAEAEDALTAGDRLALPARRTPRERRLVAAASVAIVLAGGTGIAAAAQDALPGDALYPVKRGLERAEAGLSTSQAGKGRDLLEQAGGRLDEVSGLLASGDATTAPEIPDTLTDFTVQAQQGADLLLGSYQDGGDPEGVVTVREFAADGIVVLQDLARTAPPEAQDELVAAALVLQDIDERAVSTCGGCASDLPGLQLPGIFLAAAEADRTLAGIDVGELDNSHPVVVGRNGSAGSSGTSGDSGSSAGVPAPGAPSVAPGDVLPGDDGAVKPGKPGTKPGEQAGEQAGETVDDVTEQLPDPVVTLLPDPPSAPPLPDPGLPLP